MDNKDKKKKILLLFYEPFKSGISRHIRYILSVLQDENYEFWILFSGKDQKIIDSFKDMLPSNNIESVPQNRFFSLKGLLATNKIIRKHGIDVVHIHNLQSILWGYGGSIAAGCHNIVFTPHIDTGFAGKNQWFFRIMWRIFDSSTSVLIALSQSQKDWFLNWKISQGKKIVIINNHISEKELKAEPVSPITETIATLSRENAISDRFIVTQIGRLDRQKNPFFLLQVAKSVQKTYPNILFILAGEGPLKEKIQKTVKLSGLQNNVLLVGHQAHISGLLDISDVIALTSRWEGMPYVLLEAVCFKKPVIATDIPGNKDLIVNEINGFLVDNEQQFLEKLKLLFLSPELRHQMGKRGYQMNKHLFDIQNMKEQLGTIYEYSKKPLS